VPQRDKNRASTHNSPDSSAGMQRPHLEDSLSELEMRGFETQFVVREGQRLMCGECREEFEANEVSYLKGRRVDFETDPGEQSLIAALECPRCKARGTYAFTYGPGADANEAEILRILRHQRRDQRPQV
jgi:hypothetical protein